MRELEQRLDELEGRHLDLCRSYESLQIEHSSAQQELEKLRKENARLEGSSGSSHNYSEEGEEYKSEILDPHLFDVPAFCFGQDEGTELLPLS
jgi:AP-1-like factor